MKKMPQIRRTCYAPSRPSNELLRKALGEARRLIELGHERYICHAFEEVDCAKPQLSTAARYMRWYIGTMLRRHGNHYTVESYLIARFGQLHGYSAKQVRLQWIDFLIESLQDGVVA